MEVEPHLNRIRTPPAGLAVALGAAILAASIVLALQARSTQRRDLRRDARTAADILATRLSGGVDGAVARMNLTAEAGLPPDKFSIIGTLVGLAAVTTTPSGDLAITSFVGEAVAPPDEYRALLDAARDTGEPEVDGDVLALPLYRAVPKTTIERRQQLRGFLVARLDGRRIVETPGTTRIITHRVTWQTGPSPHGDPLAVASVRALADRWTVEVWLPGRKLPTEAVLAPVFGVVLSIALMVLTVRGARMRRVDEIGRQHERDALRIVTETAALLQGGFDIGMILPAVVVTLVDELGLDGAGVVEADDAGHLAELFSIGPRVVLPHDVSEIGPAPEHLSGGQVSLIPLQRAGRMTGALWLRPRSDVPVPLVTAARGVAELLQSAIANFHAYERQEENVRRLEELDQLKTAFIGTVSHELRTPATAIVGFGSMLEANWDKLTDEQRRDFSRRATRNARSLGVLIEDLLDFARLERGAAGLLIQPVDLSQVLVSLLDRLSGVFETHDVTADVASAVVAPADPTAIERILTNLLSNATKYSPTGSSVVVSLHRIGRNVVLTVDDAGSGIPPDERTRIFSAFYRMETEAVRRSRGAGIGLAVVKELTEALGASIEVGESPLGGARFTVTIPIDTPEAVSESESPDVQGVAHVHAT